MIEIFTLNALAIPPTITPFQYLLAFALTLGLVAYFTPKIILIAMRKRLVDKPNYRKRHKRVTPNFGGLAIFFAISLIAFLFSIDKLLPQWNFVFAAALLLFITGLKDDVIAITPLQKLAAQLIASFIVVYFADIRVSDLHGFLGIHYLPYFWSVAINTIGITFIINAYNLIDGMDGLCGSLSLFASVLLGFYFAYIGRPGMALLAFCMAGSLFGFLLYNINPARIFMGDSGSLILGFFIAVMCIYLVEANPENNAFLRQPYLLYAGKEHIAIAFSFVLIPSFDAFRVLATRILHKQPPFRPDRRHIHHLLVDAGMAPNQINLILLTVNLAFVVLTFFMSYAGINPTITVMMLLFMSLGLVLVALKKRNDAVEKRKIQLEAQLHRQKIGKLSMHIDKNNVQLSFSGSPAAASTSPEKITKGKV